MLENLQLKPLIRWKHQFLIDYVDEKHVSDSKILGKGLSLPFESNFMSYENDKILIVTFNDNFLSTWTVIHYSLKRFKDTCYNMDQYQSRFSSFLRFCFKFNCLLHMNNLLCSHLLIVFVCTMYTTLKWSPTISQRIK